MLHFVEGNLFESPAQTLVNTVNTAGAMGKGLAKQYKRLFPEMFEKYQLLCESGELDIGKLWIYQTPNKWVLNFPTKKHWRRPSEIGFVEAGLRTFVSVYDKARITSIAFPQLGCGNGELDWNDVKPLMVSFLKRLPIDVYVYEVNRSVVPEHRELKRMREWLMSEPQSLPFDSFRVDLERAISTGIALSDIDGAEFEIRMAKDTTTFAGDKGVYTLPWQGDESGSGWLQLWQLIRSKGACTTRDISNLGLPQPNLVVALLLKLPYIKRLRLRTEAAIDAVQLISCSQQPSLFPGEMIDINTLRS
jgi:O-acetyl-ADP-ribose deacetylase (regulator of RNase III)